MAEIPVDPVRRAMVGVAPMMLLSASDRAATTAPGSMIRQTLSATDFGITGGDDVDETRRVQAFLDACAQAGGRTAHFGGLRVRISGPLVARNVGVVFDRQSYGVTDPGFYVSGSGYTALTVTGLVPDFNVTIYGTGDAQFGPDGRIVKDTRPAVNGIQFGHPDEKEPLMSSMIRYARAYKLSGFGIRHTICFDTTFLAESVEECGNARHYAFEVSGSPTGNCNESVWVRVQVELAAMHAMYVHPNTLMCAFAKIHSERITAVAGTPTWLLGGSCEFGSVRCQANNPDRASMRVVSAQAECRNFRVEGNIPIEVDATGGVVNFYNPIATMTPANSQNGRVTVTGGQVHGLAIGAEWTFLGTRLDSLELGFMPPGLSAVAISCEIRALRPQKGRVDGELILTASRATGVVATGDGRIRHLHVLGGSRFVAQDGALRIVNQTVTVDAASCIVGRVAIRQAALRLSGRIEGDLVIEGAPQSLAGSEAVVTGRVTGWDRPRATDTLGNVPDGTYCKHLAPTRGASRSGDVLVTGWIRSSGDWVAVSTPL